MKPTNFLQTLMEQTALVFCVGHRASLYQHNLPVTEIGPLEPHSAEAMYVPDDWSGEDFHGKVLSEYCQLFWLGHQLGTNSSPDKLIVLSQYRKFISLKTGQRRASNTPYAFVATPEEAAELNLTLDELRGVFIEERKCTLGPILKVGSLVENYARFHILSDFLRFCERMVDSGCFSSEQVAKFASYPVLIPAPSLGVHLLKDFVSDMNLLKAVWIEFRKSSYLERTGYQRRVGGFLLERLHSFLLIERLKKLPQSFIVGHQFVVVEKGDFAEPTI